MPPCSWSSTTSSCARSPAIRPTTGSFSYSLYLTHAPIVIAVYYGLIRHRVRPGVPTFLVLCAIVLPLTVLVARLFAEVFELPFQRRAPGARCAASCIYPGGTASRPATPETPRVHARERDVEDIGPPPAQG